MYYLKGLINKHLSKTAPAEHHKMVMLSQTIPKIAAVPRITIDVNKAHEKFGHIAPKQVAKTLASIGIGMKGEMKSCEACALSKAKRKPIKKVTLTKASVPGEQLYIDTTGPFQLGVQSQRYMVQVVDDYTRYGFNYFLPTKDGIGDSL